MPRIAYSAAAGGANIRHKSAATGSVAAGGNAAITVVWDTAFADNAYTVTVAMDAPSGTSQLRVHHIETITASQIVVRVVNDDAINARSGDVHAIAIRG